MWLDPLDGITSTSFGLLTCLASPVGPYIILGQLDYPDYCSLPLLDDFLPPYPWKAA